MRYLFIIFILFTGLNVQAVTFDRYYPSEPVPENGITINAGTFLKVMNLRDINTLNNDIGDECEFLNVTDMFIGDNLVIPKNTHVFGVVEDIREPVQGNDAAIKIKIDRLFFPDTEKTYYVEGHVAGGSDFYIGGGQTNPAYYRTVPHYTDGWGAGVLQLAPLNIYGYGKHMQIKAGEELIIILQQNLKIF